MGEPAAQVPPAARPPQCRVVAKRRWRRGRERERQRQRGSQPSRWVPGPWQHQLGLVGFGKLQARPSGFCLLALLRLFSARSPGRCHMRCAIIAPPAAWPCSPPGPRRGRQAGGGAHQPQPGLGAAAAEQPRVPAEGGERVCDWRRAGAVGIVYVCVCVWQGQEGNRKPPPHPTTTNCIKHSQSSRGLHGSGTAACLGGCHAAAMLTDRPRCGVCPPNAQRHHGVVQPSLEPAPGPAPLALCLTPRPCASPCLPTPSAAGVQRVHAVARPVCHPPHTGGGRRRLRHLHAPRGRVALPAVERRGAAARCPRGPSLLLPLLHARWTGGRARAAARGGQPA